MLLAIVSLVCLGSWASLFKLAGKWRYELFYFDFAIGLAIAGLIAALTLGSLGFDGFSLGDDLSNAGKKQWLFAFLAGCIFNLGNMLLLAAVSAAGMAVAFIAGTGMMLIVAMLMGLSEGAKVQTANVWLGCGLLAIAIVFDAIMYASMVHGRRKAAREAAAGRKVRGPGAVKGIVLAVIGGAIIAMMYVPLRYATPPDVGLGPYSLMLLFGIGVLVSTLVYNIFLMNLPVQGEPLEILDYLKVRPSKHLWGIAAGLVWCTGMLSNWVMGQGPPRQQLSRSLSLALPHAGVLLAALWGVLVWRELRGSSVVGKVAAVCAWLLVAGGLWMMSLAVAPAR
jgi:glucose uptake protein